MSVPRIIRRLSLPAGVWPDHVPPLLRRLYAARGCADWVTAQPCLAQLLSPATLSNMNAATALLAEVIKADGRILVVGDFDCDGATACAVAVRGLRLLGARNVMHAVPNRMVHGYGLSSTLIEELAPLQPALLVTVDHGIACHAGVAAAKARGWRVLVTDHHLPSETLPLADVIVNPNLPGDLFPSKALAGVGVIFYVLLALRARLYPCAHLEHDGQKTAIHSSSAQKSRPDLTSLLDLVAVGTVADLVPLDTNNRALVAAGLRRLRRGQGCLGLRALIEMSSRDESQLTASDIGFALSPRLNAAGRLEDMALGIELLLSEDWTQARGIAAMLEEINATRRVVQQSMSDEAEQVVEQAMLQSDGVLPMAVCLFDPHWHPGVIGLVASKLKDKLHRPVVALAPAEPGSTLLRGSARSIPGLHIRDVLAALDSRHPGVIQKFGGHAMAAGLTLDGEALPAFERAFRAQVEIMVDTSVLHAELHSDGELAAHELDALHARALRLGGPWGQGFPEPLFDGEFEVLQWRVLKGRHLKMELRHAGRHEALSAIHFNGWRGDPPARRLRLAYRLVCDDYRGGDAIQLIVEHWEVTERD
ncbi:single-stranded-DNA-specific exonuclease RecJ [Xylella taiwanensis]|uniref:Single-stranded-DNA-specific exonuclease RecJ n=1 Tax=Xylella taiwanensis TaxID=1444770 RepID=Z9JKT6_9GAMM|nr:ssDNA exonuclease RecJ [Xylella taiwanensis]